jgi:hypothetical protein
VSEGYVLELRVDPDALLPLQTGVPVLFVGTDIAQSTNWDHKGGCAVVLVPGPVDLSTAPVFFGSTELPERLDQAKRQAVYEAAAQGPLDPAALQTALEKGGETLRTADMRGVYAEAARRVALCAPHEEATLEGIRP